MTQPTDVLISLTNGAHYDGTRDISLRIEHGPTDEHLVNIDLDGATFAKFVTCHAVVTGGYDITLGGHNRAVGGFGVNLYIKGPGLKFDCALTGEQFAAILGNAVTRVSGAHISKER